jgi:hypothetical protein
MYHRSRKKLTFGKESTPKRSKESLQKDFWCRMGQLPTDKRAPEIFLWRKIGKLFAAEFPQTLWGEMG